MSSIDWATIRPAIQQWIASSSGYGVDKVIWADDGGDQPQLPYISLSLPITTPHGTDWRVTDLAPEQPPVAGQELRVRSQGMRTATLTVQCYAVRASLNAASSALEDVVASIPLFSDTLDGAGAGIGDVGAVKTIAGSRSGLLEPRAIVEITLHLGSELEGRETYVETAHGTVNESTTSASLPLAVS